MTIAVDLGRKATKTNKQKTNKQDYIMCFSLICKVISCTLLKFARLYYVHYLNFKVINHMHYLSLQGYIMCI